MKLLRQVYFGLLYALPAVLFFSYYPLISFGSDATMNFELSLPLIWLVLFGLVAFILMISIGLEARRKTPRRLRVTKLGLNFPGISDRQIFLFSLFPLYATLSIFWSANTTRAILTAGILWLVFFAVFAIIFLTPLAHPNTNLKRNILKSLFISTAAVCLFCWVQCILDLAGVPRENALLCLGCTYRTFGFPHPSGFAIEPQYMGNLLLAPTFVTLYLLAFRSSGILRESPVKVKQGFLSVGESRWVFAFAMLFSATLFVTMSRGAIYAYGVGLLILLGFAIYRRRQSVRWVNLLIIPISTFLITLIAQGVFSAVSPTSDTFISGTAKVVHQLSLGIIDFRPQTPAQSDTTNLIEAATTDQSTTNETAPSETDSPEEITSHFDGYIAASTNIRLGISDFALQTWSATKTNMLFGVGLGGAGVAMYNLFPGAEDLIFPNTIVQNEPISLLLETGLIGIALLIVILVLAFNPHSSFWRHPALPLMVALIIAYVVTFNFFSGFANALQIYLMPPLLYLCFKSQKPIVRS